MFAPHHLISMLAIAIETREASHKEESVKIHGPRHILRLMRENTDYRCSFFRLKRRYVLAQLRGESCKAKLFHSHACSSVNEEVRGESGLSRYLSVVSSQKQPLHTGNRLRNVTLIVLEGEARCR